LSSDDSTGESQAGIRLSIFIERRDENSSFDNFFLFYFFLSFMIFSKKPTYIYYARGDHG